MTSLPQDMLAIEITTPGGPEVLVATRRPVPELKAGEVLIKVAAAGVNGPDLVQRRGLYPAPPGASDIPGLEVAGEIAAVADDVEDWYVGDPVCALVTGGGYAEYCVAPAGQCLAVPMGFSAIQAAALPETWFTVWSNLVDRAKLASGETLLIHGGSGGIGTTAIQLAKHLGATVITTTGGQEKSSKLKDLGADLVIDHRTQDFSAVVKEFTNKRGVDVILDVVGGDYFNKNISLLAEEGRLVQLAFLNGPKAEVNFLPIMLKRLVVTGSTLRPRPVAFKTAIAEALTREIAPLWAKQKMLPIIYAAVPLGQAARAHEMMEQRAHIGKIILTV